LVLGMNSADRPATCDSFGTALDKLMIGGVRIGVETGQQCGYFVVAVESGQLDTSG